MPLVRFDPTKQRQTEKTPRDEHGPAILYVEDEDTNWEVTELALRDKYRLTRAANAGTAFSLMRARKFDLILMDIQLSGSDLDGVSITRIIKGKPANTKVPEYAKGLLLPDTPVVFVTAYAARYSKEELLDAGGSDMITKPVNTTRLSLVISRLMSRSALQTIQDIHK